MMEAFRLLLVVEHHRTPTIGEKTLDTHADNLAGANAQKAISASLVGALAQFIAHNTHRSHGISVIGFICKL
jgi:hypothetical protein